MFPLKKNSLIVSCQAEEEEPLYGAIHMQRMAIAAKNAGAEGIRANSAVDIKAIKEVVDLPIIGLCKDRNETYDAFITTTKDQIKEIIEAGSDYVAIDCTAVSRPEPLEELFNFTRENYSGIGIVADISAIEDVIEILPLHPDYISTTLSGYTDYSTDRQKPDIALISEIEKLTDIPVIAEGHYNEPQQIREALLTGAYAVIVGGAITRPQQITERFLKSIEDFGEEIYSIGIDLGATNTRALLTDRYGNVIQTIHHKTPNSPDAILNQLVTDIDRLRETNEPTAIGIATAGRPDILSGEIRYASDNIKGWTGVKLADVIRAKTGIPTYVNNDANLAAYGQWKFSSVDSLIFITIGTGIGGGIILNGNILNGKFGGGAEFGHIIYPSNDRKCTCGKVGCIETVASGRYLKSELDSGKNPTTVLNDFSEKIAWLVDTVERIIEVEAIYLGGVVKKYDQELIDRIRDKLKKIDPTHSDKLLRLTTLGEEAGAIGAALYSLDKAYVLTHAKEMNRHPPIFI